MKLKVILEEKMENAPKMVEALIYRINQLAQKYKIYAKHRDKVVALIKQAYESGQLNTPDGAFGVYPIYANVENNQPGFSIGAWKNADWGVERIVMAYSLQEKYKYISGDVTYINEPVTNRFTPGYGETPGMPKASVWTHYLSGAHRRWMVWENLGAGFTPGPNEEIVTIYYKGTEGIAGGSRCVWDVYKNSMSKYRGRITAIIARPPNIQDPGAAAAIKKAWGQKEHQIHYVIKLQPERIISITPAN